MLRKGIAVILVLLLAIGVCGPAYAVEPTEYQLEFIKSECEKYGLSYTLVYGVCMAESSWNVKANSGSSQGIMQLHKSTWPYLAEDLQIDDFDPYDFCDNVAAGVYKLACLRDIWAEKGYPDEEVVSLMLLSYNRSVKGCEAYVAEHGLANEYVDKVLEYKYQFEQ